MRIEPMDKAGAYALQGLGGTFVEALKDVAFAVSPVTVDQAVRTVRSIRALPLLGAFRGEPAVDIDQLARILASLGELSLALPEAAEIDLNPIIATPVAPTG